MHELLAPFILLFKDNLIISKLYQLFYRFIEDYTPYINYDDNGISIQFLQIIIHLLIQYHDPELCKFLDENDIMLEYYCYTWLLLLFVHDNTLENVIKLWDYYICYGIKCIHPFIIVSHLINNRDIILNADPDDMKADLHKILPIPDNYSKLFESSKLLIKITPPSIYSLIEISF